MKHRKIWIEAGVAILLFGGIAQYHSQTLGGLLYLAGRGPYCDWRGSLAALDTDAKQSQLLEQISRDTRLLKAEGQYHLWKTPMGEIWFPSGAKRALAVDLAEQSWGIYSPFGLGARPGDIVLDCGASVGLYAITALRAGASKVVVIEPVPDNVECLRRNLAREIAQGRVLVAAKGVWDREDFLDMNIDTANVTGHSFVMERGEKATKLKLPLTTVDKLVAEAGLPRVDYIKMDIEGAERKALEGARETLRKYHPRMAVCVYHRGDDPRVIDAKMKEMGGGYRRFCGPCMPAELRLLPEVYFFN